MPTSPPTLAWHSARHSPEKRSHIQKTLFGAKQFIDKNKAVYYSVDFA